MWSDYNELIFNNFGSNIACLGGEAPMYLTDNALEEEDQQTVK